MSDLFVSREDTISRPSEVDGIAPVENIDLLWSSVFYYIMVLFIGNYLEI